MRYQVRVAGRIFEGSDVNALLKCAVQARKDMRREAGGSLNANRVAHPHIGPRLVRSRGEMTAA